MSIKSDDKYDKIMCHLMEIKEDIAGIKEHLKTLNGKILRQEDEIQFTNTKTQEVDNKVRKVEIKLAIWSGGLLVIWAIAQVVINKIF